MRTRVSQSSSPVVSLAHHLLVEHEHLVGEAVDVLLAAGAFDDDLLDVRGGQTGGGRTQPPVLQTLPRRQTITETQKHAVTQNRRRGNRTKLATYTLSNSNFKHTYF